MRYTNNEGIALPLALWLATDFYDHDDDPWAISATSLMKSTRQLVLGSRNTDAREDVAGRISSSIGTAIHDNIEKAWCADNLAENLQTLGYPARIASKVVINPDPASLTGDEIPVYMEQRVEKQFGKWRVTGKYDFVAEGRVQDFKSTGVFSFMSGNKDADYIMQGSIYRMLDPQIITEDTMSIHFIFTDWAKMRARAEAAKGYPQKRILEKQFTLHSIAETEHWVKSRLSEIETYQQAPESDLPLCDDKTLWRENTVWKYYKDPASYSSGKRSTKNFDNAADAHLKYVQDGSKGLVVEVKGKVKACMFCAGFDLCTQKDRLIEEGVLEL